MRDPTVIRRSLFPALALCAGLVDVGIAQRDPVLPGDALQRLPPGLRAILELASPLASGWESEERVGRITLALAELQEIAASKGAFGELVSGSLRLTLPVSDPAGEASEEDSGRGAFEPFIIVPAESKTRTQSGSRAVATLSTLLSGSTDFHIIGVGEEEGHFVTEIHARGFYPDWRAAWSFIDGCPTLERLVLRRGVQVRTSSAVPLFRDATGALFQRERERFTSQLLPGISEWRARLDTRLGQPLLGHAAGIALGDVDGDGLEDLYLCQPGGLPNLLLLHRPDGSVRDVSGKSGVDYLDFSRAALLIDLDGDGRQDLVCSVGSDVLFHRGGDATFKLKSALRIPSSTSLAAADYDGDGDLDVYVCAYSDPYEGNVLPRPYVDAKNGRRNVLIGNTGAWELEDVTASEGLDDGPRRFSLAAAWEDYDRDGDPDLYVANDFGRNNLFRNDLRDRGSRRFVDVAGAAGVEDMAAGMGVSFGDVNRDGWSDLYVSNMYSGAGNRVAYRRRFQARSSDDVRRSFQRHARGNSLFLNDRKGGFVADEDAGVEMAGWAWGARFFDMNQDGWLDILSPNGLLTQKRSDDL